MQQKIIRSFTRDGDDFLKLDFIDRSLRETYQHFKSVISLFYKPIHSALCQLFLGNKSFFYYPWTKPQGEHYVKFHYLGTFYNRFHVFEKKEIPRVKKQKNMGKT